MMGIALAKPLYFLYFLRRVKTTTYISKETAIVNKKPV